VNTKAQGELADSLLSDSQRETIAQLEALGYVDGSVKARREAGITQHDPSRSYHGFKFYTSGHAAEAILLDMEGKELHRWRYEFRDVWPVHPAPEGLPHKRYWRRARLFENGDVLAIFDGLGIIKLDAESRLLWANANRAHHDLDVAPNGDIYVLTRKGRMVPRIDPYQPILEDFVTVLDAHGLEKRRFSLLRAFEQSDFSGIWHSTQQRQRGRLGDIFHTNSIELLDGSLAARIPAFKKGNLLISVLKMNAIAVVDVHEERVVWAQTGSFRLQHDPKILPDGRLLLFDNLGQGDVSRVMELDPLTGKLLWHYSGTPNQPFFTKSCGTAERLPNANTLVTESESGRAFEITPQGEIVWEFLSPHRVGAMGELVAMLFEVVRLGPDFPLDWARARRGE
jgi:hypothetical protein